MAAGAEPGPAPDPVPAAELAGLVAELRATSSDLDGHIERRVAALAAPVIAVAEEEARQRIEEADDKLQQAGGIITELRLQLEIQTRLHLELLAEKRGLSARQAIVGPSVNQ